MAKPTKFKGKQGTFAIEFVGIGLKLTSVLVKEIGLGESGHLAILEERNGRWTLLTTQGYLIDPTVKSTVLAFDRLDPAQPVLVNGLTTPLPIKVHTTLKLGNRKTFYSIDESPMGTRIQYTEDLIEPNQHHLITGILFTKVM